MLRLVLIAVFVLLVLILAFSSWRLGQRLLAALLFVIGVGLAGVAGWLGLHGDHAPVIAADTLSVRLDSANRTAQGWRLTGELGNHGSEAVSATTLTARVHACAEPDCALLGESTFTLLMHVAPGQRYPFRQALHDIELPADAATPVWTLEVRSALGYAGEPRERHP